MTNIKLPAAVVVTLLATGVVMACGGDDDPPRGAPAVPDGGVDATGPNGKLRVLAPDYGFARVAPGVGAWVSLDLPGGAHRELPVNAEGRVEVGGIDWSLGNASVIAFGLPKRSIHGVTDVGPDSFAKLPKPKGFDDADVVLYPQPLGLEDSLTVTGTTSGATEATNRTLVSGVGCINVSELISSYVVSCRANAPVTLFLRDEKFTNDSTGVTVTPDRWFKADVPAQAGALQVDVDFAKAAKQPVKSATMKIAPPAAVRTAIPNASANMHVSPREALGAFLGAFTSRHAEAGGFTFGLEWIEVAGQTPYTFAVLFGQTGASTRIVPSAPKDGAIIDAFIAPLKVTALDLTSPISLDGAAPTAVRRLVVTSGPTYSLVLDAPPGANAMHVPTTLPAELRPPREATGGIALLDELDKDSFQFLVSAGSAQVAVKFPP